MTDVPRAFAVWSRSTIPPKSRSPPKEISTKSGAGSYVTVRRRPRSGGFLARVVDGPVPRQQLCEPSLRRIGDPGENVGEPRVGIDVVELGGLDQRVHNGGSFGPALRTGEQPRFSALRQTA